MLLTEISLLRRTAVTVGMFLLAAAFLVDWFPGVSKGFGLGQWLMLFVGATVITVGVLGKKFLQAYKASALVFVNSIVLLALIELVTQTMAFVLAALEDDTISTRASHVSVTTDRISAAFRNEHLAAEKIQYTPYVLWRSRPFPGAQITISPDGLRHTPGAECKADALRIFLFGSSALWGFGAADHETIAAYVQAQLASSNIQKPICVKNFGQNGYVSTQDVIELVRQLQENNIPEIAVFYNGYNDVNAAYESGRPGVHFQLEKIAGKLDEEQSTNMPIGKALFGIIKRTQIFSFLSQVKTPAVSDMLPGEHRNSDLYKRTAALYVGNYKIIEALASNYGFHFEVFLQPAIEVTKKSLTPDELEIMKGERFNRSFLFVSRVYQEIDEAEKKYAHLHYLGGTFDDREDGVFTDSVHITPDGNKHVSGEILQYLQYALARWRKNE